MLTDFKKIKKIYFHKAEENQGSCDLKTQSIYIIKYSSILPFFKKEKIIRFENKINITMWSSLGDLITNKISGAELKFKKELKKLNLTVIFGTFKNKEVTETEFFDIHNSNKWKTGDLITNKILKYKKI